MNFGRKYILRRRPTPRNFYGAVHIFSFVTEIFIYCTFPSKRSVKHSILTENDHLEITTITLSKCTSIGYQNAVISVRGSILVSIFATLLPNKLMVLSWDKILMGYTQVL